MLSLIEKVNAAAQVVLNADKEFVGAVFIAASDGQIKQVEVSDMSKTRLLLRKGFVAVMGRFAIRFIHGNLPVVVCVYGSKAAREEHFPSTIYVPGEFIFKGAQPNDFWRVSQ